MTEIGGDAWISGADPRLSEVDLWLATPAANGAAPDEHWLIDAADLLAEPDPGPTPWLVQDLIVDQALIACVGRWKTTKSYGLLDLCISIATGEPAFGQYEIPQPGTVIFVNEESGRTALRRRLDSLCRGRAIAPERLRGQLLLGANTQIKLDSERWQDELIQLGQMYAPRLFVFDPLARMKASGREENAQKEMAPLIEFLRLLRHETEAAVSFVHHTGHQGEQMRGSSDLESAWETRLTWKRDGQSSEVTIASEHREAEAAEPITYRIHWDGDLRTMQLALVEDVGLRPLRDRIMAELQAHSSTGLTTDEVQKQVAVRRSDVLRTLESLKEAGNVCHVGSEGRDALGRRRTYKVWKPLSHAAFQGTIAVPVAGNDQEPAPSERDGASHRPSSLKESGTERVSPGLSDDIPLD